MQTPAPVLVEVPKEATTSKFSRYKNDGTLVVACLVGQITKIYILLPTDEQNVSTSPVEVEKQGDNASRSSSTSSSSSDSGSSSSGSIIYF